MACILTVHVPSCVSPVSINFPDPQLVTGSTWIVWILVLKYLLIYHQEI